MIKCIGKSVLNGIAVGRVYVYRSGKFAPVKKQIEDVDKEQERLMQAIAKAGEQLEELYQNALKTVGEEQAMIFDVHKMMLEDEGYQADIKAMISEGCNAEFAVQETGDKYSAMFAAMDDEYMRARSADVIDISGRVIDILSGVG